jgi:hypothetical protein
MTGRGHPDDRADLTRADAGPAQRVSGNRLAQPDGVLSVVRIPSLERIEVPELIAVEN